jgi:hypothetical protein
LYHFELRKFPHTVSRFNQSEQQMLALAVPWTRTEWVDVGERKWNVNDTKLTVLEGPELSLQEMSMNRGWRNARRRSEDVTDRVLAAARAAGLASHPQSPLQASSRSPAVSGSPVTRGGDPQLLADSFALEILGALDAGPVALERIWRLAHGRIPDRPPAEALALAEQAVRSLLARRLVVLHRGRGDRDADAASGGGAEEAAAGEIDDVLDAVESWSAQADDTVVIARSG